MLLDRTKNKIPDLGTTSRIAIQLTQFYKKVIYIYILNQLL
jgi:hypothetical protein